MLSDTSPIARFLVVLAAFVVVVAGMKAAESLLVPFLLSLFIAVICSPVLAWLKHYRIPNGVAILLVISVIVVAGLLIGAVVGASLNSFHADLPEYRARLQAMSGELQLWLQSMGVNLNLVSLRESFDPGVALSVAGNTLASFGNLMTNAFLILLTVVFILAEEVRFADKLSAANQYSEGTRKALEQFTQGINQYMAIKAALSLLTGVLISLWLYWLDVDYPVLWGMVAFLLNFVPTLGSVLAAVPTILLALVQLGVDEALLTALGYLLVNVVIGNVLEPRMMGRGLNLSALVVFLSLVFWGWILGPVGMLLSVPLTMTVKIALASFSETRWIGVMLGGGKPEAIEPEELEVEPN